MRTAAWIVTALLFTGCHAPKPSFNMFAPFGSSKVAPPGTGTYQTPDEYYSNPPAQAPATGGVGATGGSTGWGGTNSWGSGAGGSSRDDGRLLPTDATQYGGSPSTAMAPRGAAAPSSAPVGSGIQAVRQSQRTDDGFRPVRVTRSSISRASYDQPADGRNSASISSAAEIIQPGVPSAAAPSSAADSRSGGIQLRGMRANEAPELATPRPFAPRVAWPIPGGTAADTGSGLADPSPGNSAGNSADNLTWGRR